MYLGTILPACHMVEFRVSSFGDSGHLCESSCFYIFSLVTVCACCVTGWLRERIVLCGAQGAVPAGLGAGTPQAPTNLE